MKAVCALSLAIVVMSALAGCAAEAGSRRDAETEQPRWPAVYKVERGDTLASIAQKYYGDSSQWRRIHEANRDKIDDFPDGWRTGMELVIPAPKTAPSEKGRK
ncbi:MAG: LysM peptidoglycan-binding domain-containing protein [Planctomycetota bacterium]